MCDFEVVEDFSGVFVFFVSMGFEFVLVFVDYCVVGEILDGNYYG